MTSTLPVSRRFNVVVSIVYAQSNVAADIRPEAGLQLCFLPDPEQHVQQKNYT